MEPIIIDPHDPVLADGVFAVGALPVRDMPMPEYRPRFDDRQPERRPSMAQRMSSMSIHEVEERRPSIKPRKESFVEKPDKKFVFYRLEKVEDDWQYARQQVLPAPQNELERLAKKGQRNAVSEIKNMGHLRRSQLQKLIDDLNAKNKGDGSWEPVFVESKKVMYKNSSRVEVRSMDVIFERVTPTALKSRSKSRSRSIGGKIVDVLEPSKSKDKEKTKDKAKDKDGGGKGDKEKDGGFEDDPFSTQPLFHRTGKPMDDRGVIDFSNAGLPHEIPRDRPIGARVEERKDKSRERRDSRRRKSREFLDDSIVIVDDHLPTGTLPGILAPESVDGILRGGTRRRSRGGSRPLDPIEVEPGRRSRSRRRPSRSRSRSHARSSSRPEEIRFPPNYYTRTYMGDSSGSSVASAESRYGLDREERSSYTSQDTYQSMTGRGSRYEEGHYNMEEKPYRVHRRGSSQSGPPPKYYRDKHYTYEPHRHRRQSRSYYETIPESRQIGYVDGGVLVPRRPVQVVYDDRIVDVRSRDAENYMRGNIRDEWLDQKERDIRRREQVLEDAEYDARRRRERERDNRRSSGYDDGYYYR